jgi:threonine/homoserine/homoserine lactone efflux protein
VVLVALGVRIIIERARSVDAPAADVNRRGLAAAYFSTVGLTITNPTTILSFAALAATLGLGTSGSFVRPVTVTLGVLLGSATWWVVLVAATSLLRARLTPPVVRGISTISGAAIVLLGILAVISAFSG